MKKSWLIFPLIFFCASFLLLPGMSCAMPDNNKQSSYPVNDLRYNPNPDLSKKIVGSNNSFMSRMMPQILYDVYASSTCVIIGSVLDDSTVVPTELESVSGFSSKIYHTIASIRVLETVSGTAPSSDIIRYRQIGSDDYILQTKVKKGETCVFILKYFQDIDQYMATAFEESIFYLDGNNRLTSMSDQLFAAKYDGIDLRILLEDIQEMQDRQGQ